MIKRNYTLVLLFMVSLSSFAVAQEGFLKIEASKPVDETVEKLKSLLSENGLSVFSTVDHKKGAESVSMELRPTSLIIFGNPALGTKLMNCDQRVAYDLPMKYLVWQDDKEQTWIGYWKPTLLANKYNLSECLPVLNKMEAALAKFASAAAE